MSKKNAQLLTLLICAIGAFLAENLLYFPLSVPWMLQHTGGVPFLDMVPGRNAGKTYEIIDALGDEGRRHHLIFIWTIDLALPLLFGWSLYVAIGNAATRILGASKATRRLRWLAVAAAMIDFAENISHTVLLTFYPDRFPFLASFSGALTLTKFSLYGVSVLVAISMFSIAFARHCKTTSVRCKSGDKS